jgi:hypothetical protein
MHVHVCTYKCTYMDVSIDTAPGSSRPWRRAARARPCRRSSPPCTAQPLSPASVEKFWKVNARVHLLYKVTIDETFQNLCRCQCELLGLECLAAIASCQPLEGGDKVTALKPFAHAQLHEQVLEQKQIKKVK